MSTYDEEIRVAIIANADGTVAGTAQAATAIEGFQARVAASQEAAASAYAASQQAYAAATADAARLMADAQTASVAQTIAAYDALNVARDTSLANAQGYLAALSASQIAALNEEDYAAAASAATLFEQVTAEQAAADAAYSNAAAQLESAGALDVSATAAEADTIAQVENTTAKIGNTGATIGLAEAVGGLARGNIGMAAYGLARMGIAGRALNFIMTPLGLSILGVTAAVGGLSVAAIIGADDAAKLSDALLVTNDNAGLTTGQLERFESKLATGDTTIGTAKDAVLALARSGQFTGHEFKIAAQSVVDFAQLTGENTQTAAKYVEQLANATTQQLIKANGQYHFLSVAQFTYIENLRKEGKAVEASQAIELAFYNSVHPKVQQAIRDQGYLVTALKDTEGWFSRMIHDAESWGVAETKAQQIAKLQADLAAGGTTTDSGFIPYTQAYIASVHARIAALQAEQAQQQATAKATAAANNATQDQIVKLYGSGHAKPHHAAAHLTEMGPKRESTAYPHAILREDDRIIAGLQRDAARRAQIEAQVNSINEGAARNHAHAMLQIHLDQLRTEEAEGKISHAQELAGEKSLYAQEYAAQLAEYQKELALEKDKPVEVARINAEIEALQDKHLERMAKATETAAQKQSKDWQKALEPISQAFTTSINGIIQGTQTLQMAVANILDSILLKYVDLAIKKTIIWVAGEENMTAATVLGTIQRTAAEELASAKTLALKILTAGKTIAIDAAEAAAAVFKALAGMGPFGLALAAAGAATAIYEVKSFANFDIGAWNIPHDMPAMVHAGETILPRPFADDFRSAMSGNGGGIGGGGTTHYHIHANDAASFHDMLQRNPEALAAGMRNVMRVGAFA